ncbi:MAG: SGNH hydrolase domain-containing protein, partial [bacterium]
PFYASGSGAPVILFVGDSHAEQYYPAVQHASESLEPAPSVMFSTKGGCPFLPDLDVRYCGDVYRRSLALAKSASVRRVVIASVWSGYVDEHFGRDSGGQTILTAKSSRKATVHDVEESFRTLAADIATLRSQGKDIVIIASHPGSMSADPARMVAPLRVRFRAASVAAFASSFSAVDSKRGAAWMDGQLARVAQSTGATLIHPTDFLCPHDSCMTMDEHGAPLRIDAGHLRPFAVTRYMTFVPALLR